MEDVFFSRQKVCDNIMTVIEISITLTTSPEHDNVFKHLPDKVLQIFTVESALPLTTRDSSNWQQYTTEKIQVQLLHSFE